MPRAPKPLTPQEVYDLTEQVRAEAFEEAAMVAESTADWEVAGEYCRETVQYIARRIRCIKDRVPF